MDPRVEEILSRATDSQRRYVRARLIEDSIPKAARAIGLTRTAPHQWPNLDELEEAVGILYNDVIQAAKLALEDLALEAVQALGRAVRGKGGNSITAAKAILDRIGLPAMSNVDITSKGESIKATVYIPDNARNDRDD